MKQHFIINQVFCKFYILTFVKRFDYFVCDYFVI